MLLTEIFSAVDAGGREGLLWHCAGRETPSALGGHFVYQVSNEELSSHLTAGASHFSTF